MNFCNIFFNSATAHTNSRFNALFFIHMAHCGKPKTVKVIEGKKFFINNLSKQKSSGYKF